MKTATTSKRATKRAFNFNAGPAALPLAVLERMREEMLDYRGTGMSVMEMSHRSPEFEAINDKAETMLRRLLAIPDDYAVIFLQGGGSLQFAMVPMNLYVPGKPVDVLHTGSWTAKAIEELKKWPQYRLAGFDRSREIHARAAEGRNRAFDRTLPTCTCARTTRSKARNGRYIPETGERAAGGGHVLRYRFAAYRREAIRADFRGGAEEPGTFGRDGGDYPAAIWPSAPTTRLPRFLQYRTHIKEKSLYNTPPTFAIYTLGLVLEWVEAEGGVAAIEKRNAAKAKLLYDAIDGAADSTTARSSKDRGRR